MILIVERDVGTQEALYEVFREIELEMVAALSHAVRHLTYYHGVVVDYWTVQYDIPALKGIENLFVLTTSKEAERAFSSIRPKKILYKPCALEDLLGLF